MIDDLDEEEFDSMTEAQMEAMCQRLMKQYHDMLDSFTPLQLYRHRRGRTLRLILQQRRIIQEFPDLDFFKARVRESQHRLLKWRIEFQTGVQAGQG